MTWWYLLTKRGRVLNDVYASGQCHRQLQQQHQYSTDETTEQLLAVYAALVSCRGVFCTFLIRDSYNNKSREIYVVMQDDFIDFYATVDVVIQT